MRFRATADFYAEPRIYLDRGTAQRLRGWYLSKKGQIYLRTDLPTGQFGTLGARDTCLEGLHDHILIEQPKGKHNTNCQQQKKHTSLWKQGRVAYWDNTAAMDILVKNEPLVCIIFTYLSIGYRLNSDWLWNLHCVVVSVLLKEKLKERL